jgi:hypothetical protein
MSVSTFRFLAPSLTSIYVRDFPVDANNLLDFEDTVNCLEMGEFLTINSSQKAIRAANPGVAPGPWAMYAEKGRSDLQSFAEKRVPVIMLGNYWAETKIFNTSSPPAFGAALAVVNVTYGTKTCSGLSTYSSGSLIGYVTKTGASNNGWLQFYTVLY